MCEIERFENEGGAIVEQHGAEDNTMRDFVESTSRSIVSSVSVGSWNPPYVQPWNPQPWNPQPWNPWRPDVYPYAPSQPSIQPTTTQFIYNPIGETVSDTITIEVEQYNALVDALTSLRNIRDLADVLSSDDLYNVVIALVDSTEEVEARDALQERLDRTD